MSESAIVKTMTTFFGACIVYAVGGFDMAFKVLFFFMILDYLSGLMRAYKKKEILSNSRRNHTCLQLLWLGKLHHS